MRSICFAVGLFVVLWGAVFFLVDQMVVSTQAEILNTEFLRSWWTTWNDGHQAAFHPPEWAAFALLSIGGLTMLYSVGLPEKPKQPLLEKKPEFRFLTPTLGFHSASFSESAN